MPPFSFVLKLSIAGRVASSGRGWNENYSFVLGSGCGRRWRQNIVGRCCRCAEAGALVAAVWFDGILPQLILPEFTLNNICQSHDSQPGRRKQVRGGSTGRSWWEVWKYYCSCGKELYKTKYCCLSFVCCCQNRKFLAKTALSSCFWLCASKQPEPCTIHFVMFLPKLRTQRSSSDCLLHQHFKWEKGKQ